MRIRKLVLAIIIFCSITINVSTVKNLKATEPFPYLIETKYVYDPYPTEENPLRGFFPYRGEYDSFPHSMEFFYIPLKYLMNDFDSYTFDGYLEPWLDDIASRNHQAIFRVYLDYPDEETGIPDFLLNEIETYEYTEFGGGISPDYTDEILIATLEDLITELGTNYDGDIRIAFLQLGLLGHWGEWHTYPHDDWFPNATIQNRILTAFDSAFNSTRLVVRYPSVDTVSKNIGYHDDSFAYETIGPESWEFYNRLVTFNEDDKWKSQPIGGEVRPEIQSNLWDDYPPNDLQDFTTCVNLTHVSWLLDQDQFDKSFSQKKMERARLGALSMGYQFFLQTASASNNGTAINFDLNINNTGIAPFYYPLTLKILINGTYNQYENYTTETAFLLQPSESKNYQLNLPATTLTNTTKISFKLESSHTIAPIAFANRDCNDDGTLDLRPQFKTTTEEYSIHFIFIASLVISCYTIIKRKRQE